jgi:molybdopterin converting factor small subunit
MEILAIMRTDQVKSVWIKVIAYGIAKEIMGGFEHHLTLNAPATLGHVRAHIIEKFPDFQRLASLRFAVGENYQTDTYSLNNNDEVVIIPPVSGG